MIIGMVILYDVKKYNDKTQLIGLNIQFSTLANWDFEVNNSILLDSE